MTCLLPPSSRRLGRLREARATEISGTCDYHLVWSLSSSRDWMNCSSVIDFTYFLTSSQPEMKAIQNGSISVLKAIH
jgi:hypothetical protein